MQQLYDDYKNDYDYSSNIPDECLSIIFQTLSSGDRKRCSLVSRRWYTVEGQNRHRVALNSAAEITPFIPSLFTRFDSITKLSLQCDRKSASIDDNSLGIISLRCVNLTRLKLRGCRDVSDVGMGVLGRNCRVLRKFSCGSCMFGAKGMNALLNNCVTLEELSVKRLRGLSDSDGCGASCEGSGGGGGLELIGTDMVCGNLKGVYLKELYNGQSFGPVLVGSRNLRSLRLFSCLGEWDLVLRSVCDGRESLSEIRLEKLKVSDAGLEAIAKCVNLDTLHLMKVVEYTDEGLAMVARSCRLIRKLHIDGWRNRRMTNRIGDVGLTAVAKNGGNLMELVLIGLNPSIGSLAWISMCCTKLERLAICASDTIGDRELECLAIKTASLKKVCIKGCRLLTNNGIISLATFCPNLVKIKVKKCKRVTGEVVSYVKEKRPLLELSLDVNGIEVEGGDVRTADGEVRVVAGGEGPTAVAGTNDDAAQAESSNTATLWSGLRSRISLFGGNLVTSTVRRWSSGDENQNNN
ncbi:hypothetical protein Leryth_020886 [Lithospermum erythrorhizon]|nr:hypothetical protein Leryth_020886 [Lithospermum erythrorhizon]